MTSYLWGFGVLGSSHRGREIKKYNLWLRMGFATAVRIDGMTVKAAREKFNAPARRAREWLKEYDAGEYSNLPSMYRQEELKKMYRLKGAGKRVKDAVLEKKLLDYYKQLREELYCKIPFLRGDPHFANLDFA